MEPKFEEQKQYTLEEIAEIEKSRTISDVDFLQRGAKYIIGDDGEKRLDVTDAYGANHVIKMSEKLNEIKDLSPQEHARRVRSLFDKMRGNDTLVTYYEEGSLRSYSILETARYKVKIDEENLSIHTGTNYKFIPLKNIVNIGKALM